MTDLRCGRRNMRRPIGIIFAGVLLAMAYRDVAAADPYADAHDAFSGADYPTAYRLLPPLADQGDTRAQLMLAELYEGGLGVKQDMMKADMWCLIAMARLPNPVPDAAEHQRIAGGCSIIRARATPDQKADATELAQAWRPATPGEDRRFLIFFDYQVPNMTRAAQLVADMALLKAIDSGATEIEIVGHADTAEKGPLALSFARARTVGQFLAGQGLAASVHVRMSGAGTADPLVPTGAHEREPQDRFVVVTER